MYHAYSLKIRGEMEAVLSLIREDFSQDQSGLQTALDLILKRKALSGQALLIRSQVFSSDRYPEYQPQIQQLRHLSETITHLQFEVSTPVDPELIKAKQQEYTSLLRGLAQAIPELQLQQILETITSQSIVQSLDPDTALIEFIHYSPWKHSDHQVTQQDPHYLALIALPEAEDPIRMVDLGLAKTIDRQVILSHITQAYHLTSDIQLNMANPEEEDPDPQPKSTQWRSQASHELYTLLIEPLLPHIQDHHHLLICPDSTLNLLPFQLITPDDQTLLADRFHISYLTTGRDLIQLQQPPQPSSPPLILADPDYDLSTQPQQDLIGSGLNTLDGQQIFYRRAPGTRLLGESVAQRLGIQPRCDHHATEQYLKATCQTQSPSLLLIATHGDFFSGDSPACTQPDRYSQLNTHPDPMFRSCLALAGANLWLRGDQLPPEIGKGILFSQDILSLNLWGTQLSILSACKTAWGDIRLGEGVFGLRRAFAAARHSP